MAGEKLFLFIKIILLSFISCVEREMTVNIEAGKEECFFESVPKAEMTTGYGRKLEIKCPNLYVSPYGSWTILCNP